MSPKGRFINNECEEPGAEVLIRSGAGCRDVSGAACPCVWVLIGHGLSVETEENSHKLPVFWSDHSLVLGVAAAYVAAA
jgi:hypothetical protein